MPRSSPLRLIRVSAWSFPNGRRAIFALFVATHTGDPDAASAQPNGRLRLGQGEPMVLANGAQIRVGAGIAHLTKDSLDGTAKRSSRSDTPPDSESHGHRYMEKLDRSTYVPLVGDTSRWHARCAGTSRDFIATAFTPCLRGVITSESLSSGDEGPLARPTRTRAWGRSRLLAHPHAGLSEGR